MKKLIIAIALVTFTAAVQAGDSKTCTAKTGEKSGCCAATAAGKSCDQAKACCSKDTKLAAKETTKKVVLLSPKAAADL